MLFRQMIIAALLAGVSAGLVLSTAQFFAVNPIIFAAESFEVIDAHDHGAGSHSVTGETAKEAWAPSDGRERSFYTFVSNTLAAIGFAAILLSLMSQLQLLGMTTLSLPKGLLWGVAGFIVFFVAPGVGLPPEIPGIEAAPVENRQAWWLLSVISVALGLLLFAFASIKIKPLGLLAMAVPYMVNIPHPSGPAFTHPDPDVVASLTALHQQFIMHSAASNLLFWLVLGVTAAGLINHWVLPQLAGDTHEPSQV